MVKAADFTLQPGKSQVLVLRPFGPYYEETVQALSERSDVQVVECSSPEEMALLGRKIGACILLAHCPGRAQSAELVSLLEACREEIASRKIRVAITVSADFISLQSRFVRAGACEVIQQPISSRRLVAKTECYTECYRGRASGPSISWLPPLQTSSDFWLVVEGKTHWTPGSHKWMMSAVGPPSECGQWMAAGTGRDRSWEWIPSSLTEDPFVHEDGVWRFQGDKPEFKDGAWNFSGTFVCLSFFRGEQSLGEKFRGDRDSLRIAENSEQARGAGALIEELFQRRANRGSRWDLARPVTPPSRAEGRAASSQGADEQTVPGYLRRVSRETNRPCAVLPARSALDPVAAARFVAGLTSQPGLNPEQIVIRFCEHLKSENAGLHVEFWVASQLVASDGDSRAWTCLQHDDLIDMSWRQRIEAACGHERVLHHGEQRAALVIDAEGRRLGALIFTGSAAQACGDSVLEDIARVLLLVLRGTRQAA